MSRPPLLKHLGQHHLVQGALCRPLTAFLSPAGERVVEIGPGGGVLTRELFTSGARRVVAWELDAAWASTLRRDLVAPAEDRILDVVIGDALQIEWGAMPTSTLVAGNLPYGIATQLISRLLLHHRKVPRAAFLVQREVAERLTAGPGGKDYGALSVLVAARSESRILAVVKKGSFRPPPKVDGAFIGMALKPPPLPESRMRAFHATVQLAFGRRRKTLKNALGSAWGRAEAEAVLTRAGIDPGARAETISLEGFLALEAAYRG